MYYYKKNIGDYAKKAGRLNMLQHGAYTLIIDACYDRERFPTLEEATGWAWASSKEEIEAVTFVLLKFFDLEDGVYVQNRIKQELANFHKNSATNKRIAIERETKRKEKSTKRVPTVNEPPPNQEPLTKNHKPLTNNHKTKTVEVDGISFDDFYSAYPKKVKRKEAKAKWLRLSNDDKRLALDGIAGFIANKEMQFISAPLVYLNGARWDDEPAIRQKSKTESLEDRNKANMEIAKKMILERSAQNAR